MMSWLYYLLEANLYLILFYGFYRLFLYRETFYGLNRTYLLSTSILAFVLPFFQLGFLKAPVVDELAIQPLPTLNEVVVAPYVPLTADQPSIFTTDHLVIALYVLVTLAFLVKMFFSLAKIISMLKLPSVYLDKGVKLIDLKGSKIAFSFFNLLFLDPHLPEKNTILKHELVHIKQKHSLDVMLFEMIQVINWFNPIVYLLKQDIKLIHEYLADEETTKQDIEKYDYAMFLIQNSTGVQNLTLTNQIFSSSVLKKRITMLNQEKSATWARLKLLLVVPVTAGILCISTMAFTKDYGFVDLIPQKTILQDTVKKISIKPVKQQKLKTTKKDQIKFPPPIVRADSQTSFYPSHLYSSKTNQAIRYEKRYIVINGQPVADNSTFYGVRNTKSVKYLGQLEATKKYGQEKGKNGAVEITGDHIQYAPKISPPPTRNASSEKLKEVTIIEGRKDAITQTVKGYPIENSDNKKIQEVTIKAYKDALETKTVQGYPIDAKGQIKATTPPTDKNLKEVTIKGYEKAMDTKPDAELKEVKVQGYSLGSTNKKPSYSIVMHQDNIDKGKDEKLIVDIPDGAKAELTIYNSKYDAAFYQSTDYKNDYYAKELPNGNYPYNILFKKDGKIVGGKSGYVKIK
ncbi:M56 family metallopeptidase [Pedobacter sp. GSP4]|uniref:M56 family metallopeptidase n=1 Tax=Pedobacter sp. GSP4 TaxID=3453716 RepID=UPI003EE9506E